ncbi:MAG TPA: arylesterase [Nitrospira sp.]|nr:arylesterase [Nitrospira sp.]
MKVPAVTRAVIALSIGAAIFLTVAASIFCDPAIADPTSSGGPSPEGRPRIVAFGNSLTTGLGVSAEDSYPAQLQRRLDDAGLRYRVINAGVSGDTTAGGLRRVGWVLKTKPIIVILELGGNDGLRGLSLQETKANLERIIQQFQNASVTVVLAGMKLPPNYGTEYTAGFESIYPLLAKQYRLPLIPFFLDGVAGSVSLNQADGIHPTGEGYRIIADKVLETLKPLLERPK